MKYVTAEESELNSQKFAPLQVAFLMIRCGESYLLKRDFVGGHWELPASGINANETPRECLLRNYGGQYRLRDSDVKLLGISQVVFERTEWRPEPKAEYLALFEVTVDSTDIDQSLDQSLHLWYTPGDDVNPYCQLCRGLTTYHHSLR